MDGLCGRLHPNVRDQGRLENRLTYQNPGRGVVLRGKGQVGLWSHGGRKEEVMRKEQDKSGQPKTGRGKDRRKRWPGL